MKKKTTTQKFFARTCMKHALTTKEFMKERKHMKKKSQSLIERVHLAERRQREAERRFEQERSRRIKADMIAQGATVWMAALAKREGPVIHVSAEEIARARETEYKCRMVEDGSVDMVEAGYFEKFYTE